MKPFFRNLFYILSYTPALLAIYGNLKGGVWAWSNLFYSLGFLAILEWVAPQLSGNEHSSKSDPFPTLILLVHIPLQWLSLFTLFRGIDQGILEGVHLAGAILSTGLNSGTSATVVAHEFVHRKNPFYQFLGKHLLFTALNPYFFVEHLRAHHKWVGTTRDSASALRNESLYAFVIRSVGGQLRGAIQLENKRLMQAKKQQFSLNHYVIRQFAAYLVVIIALYVWSGALASTAYLLQGFVAVFLLEYVNYIEHYGLRRDEKTRVTEIHSWDSDRFISRFLLVDLSRHADHHYYASKPYHTLQTYPSSHKLPSGYAGLFFLAIIPPLWFKVINPRIPEAAL
ncbi:MAG: alkane 1-monooxygenase [Bacteroidia bacterium]|nr:alkane 1-monooxygenase [Bacteroidia bacterium]